MEAGSAAGAACIECALDNEGELLAAGCSNAAAVAEC